MTAMETRSEEAPELKLLRALFDADLKAAAALFSGPIVVDAPRVGRIEGLRGLKDLVAKWPGLFNVGPGAKLEPRARTVGARLGVSEATVSIKGFDGKPLRLPIAIVGELSERGGLKEARIYHYMKALIGVPGSRPSPFKQSADEQPARPEDLPDVNASYLRAISAYDVEWAVSLFADEAYIESGTWRIDTRRQIRCLYEFFLAGKEPMRLLFSTMTYDGAKFAVEWAAGHLATRESGVTVYERNAQDKLVGMRMYDFFDLNDIPGLNPSAI
jgi:hypothetical protein